MKPIFSVCRWLALLGIALYLVWGAGIFLEFEYPYMFVLAGVENAKSFNGDPASKIIRTYYSDRHLHWHTCSYEDGWCGNNSDLIAVELQSDEDGRCEILELFAYSRRTHVLVPMTGRTAVHFPSLMPAGDTLWDVGILTGAFTALEARLIMEETFFGLGRGG